MEDGKTEETGLASEADVLSHATQPEAAAVPQLPVELDVNELLAEMQQLKERYSKLLLGEDNSGGSKGVHPALALSNAITNLSSSIYGASWRLEPLDKWRRRKWAQELGWLTAPADFIVEMVPAWNAAKDGSRTEVMVQKVRGDLQATLPALRKLDTMLQDILCSFSEKDFWYLDSSMSRPGDTPEKVTEGAPDRTPERWWLPQVCVPEGGLSVEARRKLIHQRECAMQILKASMAINAQALSEMAVPDAYWETLPKDSKAALGENVHRALKGEHFQPEVVLSQIDLANEHTALQLANNLEAALHIWRRKLAGKDRGKDKRDRFGNGLTPPEKRSGIPRPPAASLDAFRGMTEKREKWVSRVLDLLWNLRLRCPGLPQSTLHVFKIQYNKDVGHAIVESYSRVLEGLAASVCSRIQEVVAVDAAARSPSATTAIGPAASPELICSQLNLLTSYRRSIDLSSANTSPIPNGQYADSSTSSQTSPTSSIG